MSFSRILITSILFLLPLAVHAELDVALTATPDPVRPGGQIDYVATVSNDGAGDLTGVEVRLIIPAASLSFDEDAISGECNGTSCDPGEIVTFTLGLLPAGRNRAVLLPIPISNSAAEDSVIPNTATAVHDGGGGAISSVDVVVQSDPGLALGVTEARDPITPAGSSAYSLVYANSAGVTLSDVTLQMPVPAGTIVSHASAGGEVVGGEVQWDLGVLEVGSSGQRTLILTNDQPASFISTSATVSNGAATETARAGTATVVQDEIPMTVILTATPDPVTPGGQINYVATVSNRGTEDLTGVEVRLIIPGESLSFDEDAIEGGCDATSCDPGETVSFSLGLLPAGQSQTLLLPIPISNSASDQSIISNTARAVHDGGGGAMSSVDVLVQSDPDLALSLIGDRNPVMSGDRSTYTLFYANSAGVTLSDVGVRLPVPEGTSVSYVSEGGEVVGSEVRWDLGELEVMSSGQRTLVLSIDQPSDFVLSTAGVSDEAETASARAGFATAVQDEIPLAVVLTSTPNPVTPGGQIDYLATVSNEGTMDLTGVELRLVIPGESLSFDEDAIAGECDATSCDPGETVEFTLGLLPAGQSRTVLLPIPVASSVTDGTVIPNTATVVHDGGRGATSSADVLVQVNPGLALGLTEDLDPVQPGGSLTYKLVYANTAGVTLSGVTIRMPFPAGAGFIFSDGFELGDTGRWSGSAKAGMGEPPSTAEGRKFLWSLGTLSPGETGFRLLTLPVASSYEETIRASAGISDAADTVSARAEAATAVQQEIPLTVLLTATPDPVMPGGQINYVATVANDGATDLTGVELRLVMPVDSVSFDEDDIGGECNGTSCDPGETIVFSLGLLPSGQQQVVLIPIPVSSSASGNTMIPNTATAAHDGGGGATSSVNVLVASP